MPYYKLAIFVGLKLGQSLTIFLLVTTSSSISTWDIILHMNIMHLSIYHVYKLFIKMTNDIIT